MSNVAIRVEDLGKQYHLQRNREMSLYEGIAEAARMPFRRARRLLQRSSHSSIDHFIWVLRNVSFEVRHGEVIGVLGRNGAGKSTLLKILSRITAPTEGSADVFGRVKSLLEVGTGFHPELTGRENIFLNGAIMGMRKSEIERKFDEIVAFSEIEEFLDTPVKRYSSGMYVRLAFAVAAHLEPEILFIDEVLAVGDIAFQKKCLGKVSEVSRAGRTVLFVSHNMAAVENLCQKGIVLQQGRIAYMGTGKDAIDYYVHSMSGSTSAVSSNVVDLTEGVSRRPEYRPLLKKLEVFTEAGRPLSSGMLPLGSSLTLRITFCLEQPSTNYHLSLGFENMHGQRIFTAHTIFEPTLHLDERVGDQTYECRIPSFTLVPGEYVVKMSLMVGRSTFTVDAVEDALRLTVTESDYYGTGKLPWKGAGAVVLPHRWRIL